jgi:phosphate-selective porin OprO/OprP
VNQTVYALKRHTRINPQLYYYTGPIGFQAEWVKEYQELAKGSQRGAVNNNSGHVTLSYVIGGDNSYDGAKPRKVADWATKELGAVEIAARYNWLDIDDVAFQGSGLADASKSVTKAQGFDFGVNWYLSRNIKISGNWEHTSFDGGNSVTRSGAKVITNRATEKVLAGRFQVAF